MESDMLQPEIDQAQRALKTALVEACAVDVEEIDTGELIRIEESLANASEAAKQAVSLRLKRRQQRRKVERRGTVMMPQPEAPISHRIFEDVRGKRWHAFAVHPSATTVESAALPQAFHTGWLVFESTDEMRRVAPIPEHWEDLSVDDLRLLCHKADSAPKRINVIEPPRKE